MTIDEARARVAKGAALLDEQRPGWAQTIDVGVFNLESCSRCILGQVFRGYDLGIDAIPLLHDFDMRYAHAFTLPGIESTNTHWRMLQDAWIELIDDRLLASPVETPIAQDEEKNNEVHSYKS